MQKYERLGHGYILKKSRLIGNWLIDPFVLRIFGNLLIIERTSKRLNLKKEKPYELDELHVSDMRCLTDIEFEAVKNASEFSNSLPDEFCISQSRCFDVTFVVEPNTKSVLIIAPYRENVEKLHRIMRENIEKNKGNSGEAISQTADELLAPTKAPPMLVTPKLSYIYDDRCPAAPVD